MVKDLTPEEKVSKARKALQNIVTRWSKEPDEHRSNELWLCVLEAEKRLAICQASISHQPEGICPSCGSTKIFVFHDKDYDDEIRICKKCGWGNKDELRRIIMAAARQRRKEHR